MYFLDDISSDDSRKIYDILRIVKPKRFSRETVDLVVKHYFDVVGS